MGTNTGNYALCHWMYFGGQSIGNTASTTGGTAANNWGETRFYTEAEWGTDGSHITGNTIQTGGTAIGSRYSFGLSHSGLASFVDGAVYSMSWYQPTYAD